MVRVNRELKKAVLMKSAPLPTSNAGGLTQDVGIMKTNLTPCTFQRIGHHFQREYGDTGLNPVVEYLSSLPNALSTSYQDSTDLHRASQ